MFVKILILFGQFAVQIFMAHWFRNFYIMMREGSGNGENKAIMILFGALSVERFRSIAKAMGDLGLVCVDLRLMRLWHMVSLYSVVAALVNLVKAFKVEE